jgi:hypothetical protein
MTTTELEAQQAQEEAEVAFSIERRIKEAIVQGREALWALAEALYEFDEAHGWLKLGHENLSQWLADADVTISRATYYRYVKTWRKLVIEKHVQPERIRQLDQSKVAIVADKVAANTVLVEDALSDVESLGAQDLREKYYDKPKPVPSPGTEDNPATTTTSDSGQLDEWDQPGDVPLDEPVTADQIGVPGVTREITIDDLPAEVEAGETVLLAVEYDFPGWVTPGAVQGLVEDVSHAVDSGAGFPRISRRSCLVAQELATAWLATSRS